MRWRYGPVEGRHCCIRSLHRANVTNAACSATAKGIQESQHVFFFVLCRPDILDARCAGLAYLMQGSVPALIFREGVPSHLGRGAAEMQLTRKPHLQKLNESQVLT